jgi:hypothetical protein
MPTVRRGQTSERGAAGAIFVDIPVLLVGEQDQQHDGVFRPLGVKVADVRARQPWPAGAVSAGEGARSSVSSW